MLRTCLDFNNTISLCLAQNISYVLCFIYKNLLILQSILVDIYFLRGNIKILGSIFPICFTQNIQQQKKACAKLRPPP